MADIKKIETDIISKAEEIAKAIAKGRDVELRKSASGVSVAEVTKKVIAR